MEDGDPEPMVKKAGHDAGTQVPRSTYYQSLECAKHPKSEI
jgi:hypothetical protein